MSNRVSVGIKELSEALGYASIVLSAKTVDDRNKNVIFTIKDGELEIVGYSPITITKVVVDMLEPYEGEDWQFRIKLVDLQKMLTSFMSLSKTEVKKVEFTDVKTKIQLSFFEEALKPEDEKLGQVSHFIMDNIPIEKSILVETSKVFPEDSSSVLGLSYYLDMLLPVMVDTSAGKLNFGEEYVFVIGTAINSFCPNKLGEAFKGITLGYQSAVFLKKLSTLSETLECVQKDGYLYIKVANVTTFIRFQPVKFKIDAYIDRMSTDVGVIVDRKYFKDVLKRMSITSVNAKVAIKEDSIHITGDGFNQEIPINNSRGEIEGVGFDFPVLNFTKCILGMDTLLPEELFLYFVKIENTYSIYFKDSSEGWFSVMQVR